MPTYDYKCDACSHVWEEFQSITAEPLEKCPKCRKKKARRQISAGAGIIFRGSGFYQTDYRSESYTKAAEADTKAQSGTASDSKAETKSEAKTESKPAASDGAKE